MKLFTLALCLICFITTAAEPIQLFFKDHWNSKSFRARNTIFNLNKDKDIHLKFPKTTKNFKQVFFLYFPKIATDLNKFEFIEFESIYPTNQASRYKMTICGPNEIRRYQYLPDVQNKQLKNSINLNKYFGKIKDHNSLKMLYIMHYTPAAGMQVVISNLRFVDYTPVRLAELVDELSKIDSPYLEKVKQYQQEYSHNLSLEKIEAIRKDIKNIVFSARKELKKKLALAPKSEQIKLLTCDQNIFKILNVNAKQAEKLEDKQAALDKAKNNYSQLDNEKLHIGLTNNIFYAKNFPHSLAKSSNNTINLDAARGEFEPFMLFLMAGKEPLKNVKVELQKIEGNLDKSSIEISPLGWRLASDGEYYAEMLRRDIKSFSIPSYHQQIVWVNVQVPANSQAKECKITLKVSAQNVKPQIVTAMLNVWPFTLPTQTSFNHIVGFSRHRQPHIRARDAKLIANHRVNSSNMYEFEEVSLAERQQYFKNGNSLFNLMRLKSPGTAKTFEKLKRVYQETQKDKEILQRSYIYGFDEVQVNNLSTMQNAFAKAKEICPGVPTICAINVPLWKYTEKLKYPDILALTLNLITPEAVKILRSQNKKIWWYNLFCLDNNPMLARAQFLATQKTQLSGALFYNITAGSVSNYGPNLYQESLREGDGIFSHYGLLRRNHRYALMSTLAFEMWREGLEDFEYWTILKNLTEKMSPKDKLYVKANKILDQYNKIYPDLVKDVTFNEKDGCLYDSIDSQTTYEQLMTYRAELAKMICEILNGTSKN